MSTTKCFLRQNAISYPSSLFIDGEQSFTYLEFDSYVEQIGQKLQKLNQGDVITYKVQDPLFAMALLLACIRKKMILFLLNPKLPESELLKRVKESNAKYHFEKAILYKKNRVVKVNDPLFIEPSLPTTYLLTSGSTSDPKICVHSLQNHIYSAIGSNKFIPFKKNDHWLLSLPLFHVGGLSLIFRTLLAKATLTFSSKPLEFSLEKYAVTHLSVVSTQLYRLLEKPSLLKSLKVILLGGGPISESLYKKALEHNSSIYTTYGLTEMSSQVASAKSYYNLSLLPYRELTLDNSQQILVRGPTLFMGYLKNQVITPSLNKEGWFETKDLGEKTFNQLKVIGRLDNQFISGGENIQPEEIEFFLLKHPQILEAIIVPKKDLLFDQVPIAYIKTSQEISNETLIAYLENFLPRFKIPKTYLPLVYSTLKPSRKKLSSLQDS